MKLNDLNEEQLKIIADYNPKFMADYNPELPELPEEIEKLLK